MGHQISYVMSRLYFIPRSIEIVRNIELLKFSLNSCQCMCPKIFKTHLPSRGYTKVQQVRIT